MRPSPPARRTAKKYAPKSYRSRKYRNAQNRISNSVGNTVNIANKVRQNTFLPQSLICKTRYVRTFLLNPGINTPSTATFRANDLFNPEESVPNNGTVSQHQPIGFDQMAALYLNYKVLGSKIKVIAVSDNATAVTANMYISLQKHENASYVPADISLILERGMAKVKFLGATDSGSATCTLNEKYSLKRDQPNRAYDSNQLGSGAGSINAEDMYFYSVSANPSDGTNDPAVARILVQIDYIVQWSSPIQINRS